MTPAERDEVRVIADLAAASPLTVSRGNLHDIAFLGRAGETYVPPGDASHAAVRRVDVESDLPPAFRHSVVLYGQHRMQPAEARAIAHALHAAADAAEERSR